MDAAANSAARTSYLRDIDEVSDEDDSLEHGKIVMGLIGALHRLDAPSVLAIYGPWGSGKTALMRRLRKHVSLGNIEGVCKETVWFNPWKYEFQGSPLSALVKAVLAVAPLEDKIAWKKLLVGAGKFALKVASKDHDGKALAELIEGASSLQVASDILKQADEVADLSDSFATVTNSIVKTDAAKATKMVIFVDDLDRCAPDSAVKLLESLKLFLADRDFKAPVIFVLALDRTVISEAVSRKYQGMESFDGDRFLEKIVDHFFVVPSLAHHIDGEYRQRADANIQKLILNLAKEHNLKGRLSSWFLHSGDDAQKEQALVGALGAVLRRPLFSSPRFIKKFFNRLADIADIQPMPNIQNIANLYLLWVAVTVLDTTLRNFLMYAPKHHFEALIGHLNVGFTPVQPPSTSGGGSPGSSHKPADVIVSLANRGSAQALLGKGEDLTNYNTVQTQLAAFDGYLRQHGL